MADATLRLCYIYASLLSINSEEMRRNICVQKNRGYLLSTLTDAHSFASTEDRNDMEKFLS